MFLYLVNVAFFGHIPIDIMVLNYKDKHLKFYFYTNFVIIPHCIKKVSQRERTRKPSIQTFEMLKI